MTLNHNKYFKNVFAFPGYFEITKGVFLKKKCLQNQAERTRVKRVSDAIFKENAV